MVKYDMVTGASTVASKWYLRSVIDCRWVNAVVSDSRIMFRKYSLRQCHLASQL